MKEILLTSGVLILVIAIARLIFRGKVSQRFLYGAWLLVAIRLLVPIQFGQFDFSVLNRAEPVTEVITEVSRSPVSGPSRQEIYQQVSRDFSDLGYDIEAPEIQVQIDQTVSESITAPTVGEIATTVWIVGMVGMAIWFCGVNILYARKLRRSSVVVEEGHIPVRVSVAISSPCLFGLFRPTIYLTPACAENEQMRRHVLTHELTHRKYWDHIWSLVRCVCLCIYWFNPLVWLAAYLSRRDCELACDEAALKYLGDAERIAYGRTLVDMVAISASPNHLLQTATAMHESKKQLKERVNFIVKKPKVFITAVICMLLILGITAGCAFAGANQSAPADPQPNESTAPSDTSSDTPSFEATGESADIPDPSPDVMALFPDIPAVTELTETPAKPNAENMVTTVYDVSVQWETNENETVSVSMKLPALTPISEDAVAINERIRKAFGYWVDGLRQYCERGYSSYYRNVHYEVWLNGDVLSLLITTQVSDASLGYRAYSLNIATGQEIYTADFAQEYYDMSYPEFLHCSATYLRDYFQDEIPDDLSNPDIYTVQGMDAYTLFVGENGQIMLCGEIFILKYSETDSYLLPFDATATGPASEQREKNAYHWLFHLKTDGAITETYGTLLANAFLADPETFVSYLAEEDADQIGEVVTRTAHDLLFDAAEASKNICLQLYNGETLTDAEKDTVMQMLEVISPEDYKKIRNAESTAKYKADFVAKLKSRTLIPASEYTCKVVCIQAYDPVGYAAQSEVAGYIYTTPWEATDLWLEIYNPDYTDAQCPESYAAAMSQYDDAFFEDHVLLKITVITQKGILPKLNRLYTGEYHSELSIFNAYVDNVVDDPTDTIMYQILIELPISYWDGETKWFPAYGKDQYSDWLWFWENN